MTQEEIQTVAFEIILHSGDARTLIHKSFGLMREGKDEEALANLDEANNKITLGHKAQTSLLQAYASGEDVNVDGACTGSSYDRYHIKRSCIRDARTT